MKRPEESINIFSNNGTVWTLTDGHAGNLRQALALAAALGHRSARSWRLVSRAPWRWGAPRRLPGARHAFGADFTQALALPPALAIGCGRHAALATRLLGEAGARTVQILDPRIAPAAWDLVVAPEHDGLAGPNVLTLAGSLNPVDDAWLARGREDFPALSELPRPRIALLLGGSSRHAVFDRSAFEALAGSVSSALARDGGSVLATVSRRTPAEVAAALGERMRGGEDPLWPGVAWLGPDDGINPYAGLLAWADRIVCTPDSVNMVSEACATRAPVFVFNPLCMTGRPRRFLDGLLASGRIRPVDGALARFRCEPLRETARIAAEVRRRLPELWS